jgi:hypothetical protein
MRSKVCDSPPAIVTTSWGGFLDVIGGRSLLKMLLPSVEEGTSRENAKTIGRDKISPKFELAQQNPNFDSPS